MADERSREVFLFEGSAAKKGLYQKTWMVCKIIAANCPSLAQIRQSCKGVAYITRYNVS